MRLGEGALDRVDRFRPAGRDARAVEAHAIDAFDQPELDRVPVEPRQVLERPELVQRPLAALAIGFHVIGEDRVGQHRHMAEHVVEDIGLLQIVELAGAADELAGREAPVGEMVEEDLVRHQRRHRDDAPAGLPVQRLRQPLEVRNAVGGKLQLVQAGEEFVAGAAAQHLGLALEQRAPHGVLRRAVALPMLGDGEVRCDIRMLGAQLVEAWHAGT
ncbi:MAG: hypothetical protein WDN03_18030 [Rhizomicrobium sp.]